MWQLQQVKTSRLVKAIPLHHMPTFRQANSGATVLANGYRYSGTANKMQSSLSSSYEKCGCSYEWSNIIYVTLHLLCNGTDLTPTERVRIEADGDTLMATSLRIPQQYLTNGSKQISNALMVR